MYDPHRPQPQRGGRSILEMIEGELDDTYAELKATKPTDPMGQVELQGACHGLALAVSIIRNPYDYQRLLPTVKKAARERWREKQS